MIGTESFQALISSWIARSTGLIYGINYYIFIYLFICLFSLLWLQGFFCGCCQHFLSFLDARNAQDFCHKCCDPGLFQSEKEVLHSGNKVKFLLPALSVVTSLITRGCCAHAGLKTACSSVMEGLKNSGVEGEEERDFVHLDWQSWPWGRWSVICSEFCVLVLQDWKFKLPASFLTHNCTRA